MQLHSCPPACGAEGSLKIVTADRAVRPRISPATEMGDTLPWCGSRLRWRYATGGHFGFAEPHRACQESSCFIVSASRRHRPFPMRDTGRGLADQAPPNAEHTRQRPTICLFPGAIHSSFSSASVIAVLSGHKSQPTAATAAADATDHPPKIEHHNYNQMRKQPTNRRRSARQAARRRVPSQPALVEVLNNTSGVTPLRSSNSVGMRRHRVRGRRAIMVCPSD
jgi:hypothetical protein